MARYVDGFVLPVPNKNAAAYRRIARKAGRIWREHGALDYEECVADDVKPVDAIAVGPRFEDDEREGDEGRAAREHDEPGRDAVRRQAHDLRRVRGRGRRVSG